MRKPANLENLTLPDCTVCGTPGMPGHVGGLLCIDSKGLRLPHMARLRAAGLTAAPPRARELLEQARTTAARAALAQRTATPAPASPPPPTSPPAAAASEAAVDPYAPKPIDPTKTYPIRGPAFVAPTHPPLPRELTDLVKRRGAAPVLEVLEELAAFPPWRLCSAPGCKASIRGELCPRHRP